MSPINYGTGQTGRIRNFIREKISPRVTNLYARMGFANRTTLVKQLRGLQVQDHESLLNLLYSSGILKGRFLNQLSSVDQLQPFMLAGSVTPMQFLHFLGTISSLPQTLGATVAAQTYNTQPSETPLNIDTLFTKTTVNVASMLDRIFPTANGMHSKLAQGVGSAMGFYSLPSGAYRLSFGMAITLGITATLTLPFMLPALGSAICSVGFAAKWGLTGAGALLTSAGWLSRIAGRYAHRVGENNQDPWFAKFGRWKKFQKYSTPLGLIALYSSLTFDTSVPNTFVLGDFLLNNGTLLGGITLGIPLAAILGSLIYRYIGARHALRACEGTPAPFGDEKLRATDIKKTFAYSGTAFIFSITYFLYRWIATSLFVGAAFSPIGFSLPFALTLLGAPIGFLAGYALPTFLKKYRSPFPGFLSGTLGSAVLPMTLGLITGDYYSLANSISAFLSLAVFAQDIHSFTHGVMYHWGQISSLYPDRLVPLLSISEKKAYAGYYRKKGERPLTAFVEKPFVEPSDIIFSALPSALFDAYAHIKQFVLECDSANRGTGAKREDVRNSIKIVEETQGVLDELYNKCRETLDAIRRNPSNLAGNYQTTIELLEYLANYFQDNVPIKIKQIYDKFKSNLKGLEWKAIYDATCDISRKKGKEFEDWAKELKTRLGQHKAGQESEAQLSMEEVETILRYLCDRFDKEFIIGIRKDSNEYVMRVQKNENQSGMRELIGNTAYEIVRFNEKTGQASIERILSTHIRRQDMTWDHTGEGKAGKYRWYHRTSKELEDDPEVVRKYRERVKSHSKDLAFVINDENGTPLALQTQDGQILLIDETLNDRNNTLITADGTRITIKKAPSGFQASSSNGESYQVTTIREYNKTHDNKIYFIADPTSPKSPRKIEDPPENISDYYTEHEERPLFTYSIDPHDYEFNLDSEFVNIRTAFEYIPLFENDRKHKYVSISYAMPREVKLDYDCKRLSLPVDNGKPLLPFSIQITWAPMYMRVKTKGGKEYIIPYLEEKNGQIEPTVTVDESPITSWEIIIDKYARYFEKGDFKNGKFVASFKGEWFNEDGVSEIILELPAEPFTITINGQQVQRKPASPEEFTSLLTAYLSNQNNRKKSVSITHRRKYNWRRIIKTEVDYSNGKIYFVFKTDNGTKVRNEIWRHQGNADVYSIHLPPISEIESIETEVFRQNVGTVPFARYTYRFNTLEEAKKHGYIDGYPIFMVFDENGKVIAYEIERFGRPESIFELGAFDPASVDPQTVRVENGKLTFKAIDWGTKLFPIEPDLIDLGTEENTRAEIVDVITDQKKVEETFGNGSIVWIKDASGNGTFVKLGRKLKKKKVLSIVDVKAREEKEEIILVVTRKQEHGELTFTNDDLCKVEKDDQGNIVKTESKLWYPPEWIEKVELESGRIKISYKNPYTGQTLGKKQIIESNDPRLRDVGNYHEPKLELREIYNRQGDCFLIPYLTVTRVEKEEIHLEGDLNAREKEALLNPQNKLSILTPQSALKLKVGDQEEVYLPLNDRIDGEGYIFKDKSKEQFADHLPRFEYGKVGLIIGPQLSISGRNWYGYAKSGHPYCALDQSIFMAYDLTYGYNYGRQPYAYGVGGGNIQPAKSRAGDGRLRETTTVQNGTPVGRPLRKTLASAESWNETEYRVPFFSFAPMPATITEDYREGKGIYKKHGHATVFYNKVVSIGAGAEFPQQILQQRRRWPTSVPIGQFWFFRDLWDEIIRSKFLRKTPSFYTWGQLLHEWNGVTWYYCGAAEYLRSFAPMAYFAGFITYPVDPIAFPIIWAGSFASSMLSHIYSMKKVGNHPLESIYWGQAAYKALVPNYVEMITPPLLKMILQKTPPPNTQGRRFFEELFTCQLAREFLGQFGVTALVGAGKMPERYQIRITDDMWLKLFTFLRGLIAMGDAAHTFAHEGQFSPELFSRWSTYFAILMNTIWPFYDAVLNYGALKLANNDREKDSNLQNTTRFRLIADMLQDKLDSWRHPINRNKMRYTLGITDAPKNLAEKARYLKDLTAEEIREVFRYMPWNEAAKMLNDMLNAGFLLPVKVATIFEAMLYNDKFALMAASIFRSLIENNQQQVRKSMQKEKRDTLDKILAQFSR